MKMHRQHSRMGLALLLFGAWQGIACPALTQEYDIDGSGYMDSRDAQWVIDGALGLPVPFLTDLDGNGNTDAVDVQVAVNAVTQAPTPPPIPTYGYEIVHVYLHDSEAFTQGLVYKDGLLYESTGIKGQSSIREVELETGSVLRIRDLGAAYFGEGLAVVGNRAYQLTWRNQTGFVYARDTFEPESTFQYAGEGWGLAFDGNHLIMSDGTSYLRYLDTVTLNEVKRIQVTDDKGPVIKLNELEFIKGEIFANVWTTDTVVRIAPLTGKVVGRIDLSGLLTPAERRSADVLNGIAYDAAHDRLFVTGKRWPKLFEITLKERVR